MSLGDHLDELRRHLGRAVAGLVLAVILVFAADAVGYVTDTPVGIARPVKDLITRPVEKELQDFYDRRVKRVAASLRAGEPSARAANEPREVEMEVELGDLSRRVARRLGVRLPEPSAASAAEEYLPVRARVRPLDWSIALSEAQRLVSRRPSLATMSAPEAMMVYLKVALVCGLVLSSPWVFWQLWSFVAAGLYAHEKRPVYLFLPFSIGLFLGGVLFCQLLVMPRAVEALLWFNEWLDLEPELRLSEWLGFAVWMPLLFGVSFQTPLVMLLLDRLGILGRDVYRAKRRLAWFLLAVFAAVVSPSPEVQGVLLLWVPMCLLYELGIVLCRWSPRPAADGGAGAEANQAFEG